MHTFCNACSLIPLYIILMYCIITGTCRGDDNMYTDFAEIAIKLKVKKVKINIYIGAGG